MMEHLPAIVMAIVAVCAAVLSTYNLIIHLRDWRRRLGVSLEHAMTPSATDGVEKWHVLIAANIGRIPVTVSSHGLMLPRGNMMTTPNPKLGDRLPLVNTAGKSCQVFYKKLRIDEDLRELGFQCAIIVTAYFRGQIGDTYRGNSETIDVGVPRCVGEP